MVNEVGGLARQRPLVVAEGGDDGFGRFLTEFARAALAAGVQQFLGVRAACGLAAASMDQRGQPRQDLIRVRGKRHCGFPRPRATGARGVPPFDQACKGLKRLTVRHPLRIGSEVASLQLRCRSLVKGNWAAYLGAPPGTRPPWRWQWASSTSRLQPTRRLRM